MRFFTAIAWVFRAVLFIALFLFALKNVDPVTIRFYFDQAWQAPLIVALLAFFVLGAALGVLACLSKLFAQRREISALKRSLREAQAADRSGGPLPPAMGA